MNDFFSSFFIARFSISTEVVYLQCCHGLCHMKLLPSRRVLCTPYNHAPCHFMQNHIRKVYACLAVTSHLHVWQNGRGLLRVTAVTRNSLLSLVCHISVTGHVSVTGPSLSLVMFLLLVTFLSLVKFCITGHVSVTGLVSVTGHVSVTGQVIKLSFL